MIKRRKPVEEQEQLYNFEGDDDENIVQQHNLISNHN